MLSKCAVALLAEDQDRGEDHRKVRRCDVPKVVTAASVSTRKVHSSMKLRKLANLYHRRMQIEQEPDNSIASLDIWQVAAHCKKAA